MEESKSFLDLKPKVKKAYMPNFVRHIPIFITYIPDYVKIHKNMNMNKDLKLEDLVSHYDNNLVKLSQPTS